MSDSVSHPHPSHSQSHSPSVSRIDIERSVVSRSRYPNKSSLDRIARSLRALHATGKLTINFSQGGVNSVLFEAIHVLNGSDQVELHFHPPQEKT